ncbi:hypothetical protein [Aquitalea pelogenes]|uniref:hypothetical protein n=1 Tax=Aquitalea pelogenes TaxID=1293573 RepID=UPI0035B42B7B
MKSWQAQQGQIQQRLVNPAVMQQVSQQHHSSSHTDGQRKVGRQHMLALGSQPQHQHGQAHSAQEEAGLVQCRYIFIPQILDLTASEHHA